ncbi:MAG: response regulator transcription factor [Acidimicrobiales bacterium]
MIRTVVVDDDFRVAAIHAAYVEKVEGFTVVGQAHSAQATFDAVERLRPDLVLLDLYLPDQHGLDVLRRLREPTRPPLDVIVVTAARDTASVQAAMQGGALHYLLKPFGFPTLREKLVSYLSMRAQLATVRQTDQVHVDRIYGAMRGPPQAVGQKGRSLHTLETVEEVLARAGADLSASEVAERTGMSRATAQRYLSQLLALQRATMALRYGTSGRPEHRYRWSGAAPPDAG